MGPVRVPDEAGNGKARLTISFPSWNAARVAPATYQLRLVGGDANRDRSGE